MHLDSKYSGSERAPKRAPELEDTDVERAPTSKRYPLPNPSTYDRSLHGTLASPSIVPTQPKTFAPLKRFLEEENDLDRAPTSKRPILSSLAAVRPHREECSWSAEWPKGACNN